MNPTIWTTAHTTQFALPGWRFLEGSGRGMLPLGGSWVAYVPAPNNAGSTAADPPPSEDKRRPVIDAAEADFTVVFEKLNGDCLRCQVCYCAADIMRIAYVRAACCFPSGFLAQINTAQVPPTAAEVVSVQLQGALASSSSLACWLTNSTHQFLQLPGVHPSLPPTRCDSIDVILPLANSAPFPSLHPAQTYPCQTAVSRFTFPRTPLSP